MPNTAYHGCSFKTHTFFGDLGQQCAGAASILVRLVAWLAVRNRSVHHSSSEAALRYRSSVSCYCGRVSLGSYLRALAGLPELCKSDLPIVGNLCLLSF